MESKLKNIFLCFLFLSLFFSFSLAHAWVEPTTVPPGNNIFAPLNSSAFGQSKVGGLILNLGNAAHGLIVRYGLVGIGTDNPQAALDVSSTSSGVLFPRMNTAQRDAIGTKVEGLLIYNTETKQLEVYSDGAWKASSGGGDSLPKGTIAFFNLSACPSGWTEKTELKGRYPIGLPTSGTLGQSVGTALTNGENRSVGQHSHGVTDPGHAHGVWDGGHAHGVYDPGHSHSSYSYLPNWMPNHPRIWALGGGGLDGWEWFPTSGSGTGIGIYGSGSNIGIYGSGTNIGINNAGSIGGTNAPYVQFLACEKLTLGSPSSGGATTSANFWQSGIGGIHYSEGIVGIGTSNPSSNLEVNGSAKAGDIYTNDGVQIQGLSGRNYFRDAEGAGNLRVGAAWGMPGIYAESGRVVVGGADGVSLQNNSAFVSNNGNVGIGTNGPVSKLDVRGKVLFTRDGVGECCGNDATLSLGESTYTTGKRASISFHNAGRHEGTFDLAPDGERRFRMYDNQGARMGLETTGNVRVGDHLCIRGDCRPTWSEPRRHCFWMRLETHWMAACPDGYHVDGMALTNASAGCWEAGCQGGQSSWVTAGGFLCCND